jgi:hypothetical protein
MAQGEASVGIPLAPLRTAISWPLANLSAHLFQILYRRGGYIRIRYEDFVSQPREVLRKLGEFLGADFEAQAEMLEKGLPIPLTHQIQGNRMRSQKRITLRLDDEWRAKLRWHHRTLFWLTSWPLAILYGYR